MSLVCLRDVTRTVTLPDGEDLHILRGVNLDVAEGEHVSIVGRSGTGKSTMLNIIGLLDAPTSGTYELDGVDTTRLGEGRRARMRGEDFGFVFQQFNILSLIHISHQHRNSMCRPNRSMPRNPMIRRHQNLTIGILRRRPLLIRGIRLKR